MALKIIGIVLVCDGVGSLGWYKSDILLVYERMGEKGALIRTGLRLLRIALGVGLILVG